MSIDMAITTTTQLIQNIREKLSAEYSLFLMFGDAVFEVKTNSASLRDSLEDYFRQFVVKRTDADILITAHEAAEIHLPFDFTMKQPDPGKTKIKEEYVDFPDGRIVRKRLTGMVFIFGKQGHLAVGPCRKNSNQVVNFINNRFIEHKLQTGCLLGHAAGVSFGGRGLALAGFSGAGKSSLALHLMSRGTTFVSNDRLMVRQNGDGLVMYGVAKLPRINPGTAMNNENLVSVMPAEDRAKFAALPPDELWNLEHKYDVYIDRCFGKGCFDLKASMSGLVILNWARNGKPTVANKVNLRDRRDLLRAFMKPTGLFFLPDLDFTRPDPTEEQYLDVLSRCETVEISGGIDFEKACDICVNILANG